MIASRLRPAPDALPLGRDAALWFAPWLIALMVYVAGLAGIGVVMVRDTLRAAQDPIASRLTVQLPADASPARLQTVLAALRQTAGIRSAQLLTPAETARLLEPWLGSPAPVEELPVPRLIDVAVDPSEPVDLAKLRQQLAAIVPDLRLDDHLLRLDGLRATALALQALLGAAIGVALVLVGLLAVFSTVTALAARGSVIDLLHLLGAADRDIARPYAIRAVVHGLAGGGIGGVAVLLSLAVLDNAAGLIRLPAPSAAIGWADWRLWIILIAVGLAAGLVAAASARVAVLRHLARVR